MSISLPATPSSGRVYGYARVSTARQANEGESLDVQQRTIEGYAMMNGMTVAHIFVEQGVSGSTKLGDRPEGAALLGVLQPGDIVITPKLDRMFRSALNALTTSDWLRSRNVGLHMVDMGGDVINGAMSKLMFTVMSAFAEAERDRIRERIRDVKQDQKTRGRYLGGAVPWTHTVTEDGAIVADPARVAVIDEARQMRARAKTSFRQLTRVISERGFPITDITARKLIEGVAA
jgi:DNA invertase Pin-like site-specific DNA recombinase